jgi:hypothetical protein
VPEQTCFYVFQIDSRGQVDWVFPKNSSSPYSSGSNPVPPNTTIKVPEGNDAAFFLDDHNGIEHLYVVATRHQWIALEAKLAGTSRAIAARSDESTSVEAPIGLGFRGIGGIASDDSTDSPPATGIQGVLAKEIWFHHVEPLANHNQ